MSKEKINSVFDFFGGNARGFLSRYSISTSFIERHDVWFKVLKKYSSFGNKVLDMGCGPGRFSFLLASMGCDVIGLDGSKEMIRFCNEYKKANNINNAFFYEEILPFESEKDEYKNFDVIIASSLFEYIEDVQLLIVLVEKMLKPEGVFILSLPNSESLYRRIERVFFKFFQFPEYYRFVRHIFKKDVFDEIMRGNGFSCLDSIYYSSPMPNFLRNMLSVKISNDLFLCVYKKK